MAEIKGEKIGGKLYRCCQMSNGEWSDPLADNDFWSTTYMPTGTRYKEANTPELMIQVIKTDKVPLLEKNMSEETIKKLDTAKVDYEKDIKPIEKPKIGGEAEVNT